MILLKNKKLNNIWNGSPLKKLTVKCSNIKSGRNNLGRITVRHRSSKTYLQATRLINEKIFHLSNEFAQVLRLERDTKRSTFLALIRLMKSGFLCYISATSTLKVGAILSINPVNFEPTFFKNLKILTSALPIYKISRGTLICNIENFFLSGSVFCKSAGSKAKIQAFSIKSGLVSLLLPSGKTTFLPINSHAFVGVMSNSQHHLSKFYKAGQNRNLGQRPSVRGVAMNPIDHPHGGGEGKTSGGRLSVSPWGKLTKGFKTTSVSKHKKHLYKRLKFLSSNFKL